MPTPHQLQTELEALAARRTPLHMPGHKRSQAPAPGLGCFAWDLTEIPGSDDLHDADGILAAAMQRTAALCGSARCWYLVNGSTVGLLAGIRALAPFGGEVLVGRNCHKAVYHALELNHLTAHWLTPPLDEAFGIYGSITPAQVEAALTAHPATSCVILTSPTYEGVLSDLAGIAACCHRHGVPLLVDEAHGAHYLPLAAAHGWRGGAVAAGADLVVQSPHKTLPSLTQTALLHRCGDLVDDDAIERQLGVFETSSPSYPLLASLDGCTGLLAQNGDLWFARWRTRLDRFDAAVAACPLLARRLFCHGDDKRNDHPTVYAVDPGKILMRIGPKGADFLRAAGLEPEMVCGENVLAMTSPCDEEDTLDRLADALAALARSEQALFPLTPPAHTLPPPGPARCTIAEALRQPSAALRPGEALGNTAGEYVWAYPPGVPLIAPGEEITSAFLAACRALQASGTALHHTGGDAGLLRVVKD